MKTTPEEMFEYVSGGTDPERAKQILKELEDPNSEASKFVDEMVKMSEHALDVDWGKLISKK
jgi:hypothetical protein